MADILGIFNHIQQQGEKGKQSRLARMLGEAYNAPMGQRQEALGRIAQVDGGLAMNANKAFREEDGEVLSQLSDRARQVVALYKADPNMAQQAYQAMLPLAQRAGITTAPQQLDDTVIGGLTQLAEVNVKAGVPAGIQEFDYLTRTAGLEGDDRARAARINLGMDPRASSAAIQYREVEGPDGRKRLVALDPRDVGAHTIGGGGSYGSGVPSPQAPGQPPQGIPPGVTPQQVQAAFQAIGARNGFEITSMQRPVMPGIGAGANSQHPNGTAVDYRTRGKTPEQIEALKRDLAAAGFEVIDESDGRTGTGPHIHAELPPGAGGAPAGGVNPFVSRRPEDEEAAKEAAKRGVGLQFAPAEAQAKADETRLVEEAKAGVSKATEQPKARLALNQATARMQRVDSLVDSILPRISGATSGFIGGKLAAIPGTPAHDLQRDIGTLQAIAGFDELNAMRASSPTGGALGNVTERELAFLQSVIRNIENSQSPDQLRRNVEAFRDEIKGTWRRVQEAYEKDFGGEQPVDRPQGNRLRFNPATGRIE